MSNSSQKSGFSITTVILLMVITALSVVVIMLLLEKKNISQLVPSSIEKEYVAENSEDETAVLEELTEEALAAEEKAEEIPAIEEKIAEILIAENKTEEAPAVEEKKEEIIVAEEKPEETPAAEEKKEEVLIAEEKKEEEPQPVASEIAKVETEKAKPAAIDLEYLMQKGDEESLAKAAHYGYAPAQVKLAKLYEENQDLKSAAYWFELAAQKNDAEANYKLGRYYLHGFGEKPRDANTAMKYLSSAARLGQTDAMTLLGNYCYYFKEYDKALGWFREAAAKEDPVAIYKLGVMYEYGEGVAQDHDTAFKYFKTAAEKDHIDAWINLGIDYLLGRGTEKDLNQANYWIGKAAKAEKPAAQKIFGDIYYNGWGVPADRQTAAYWYEKAVQGGSTDAKEKLAQLRSAEKPPEKPREKAKEITKETPKEIAKEKPSGTKIRKRHDPPKASRKGTAPGIYKATLDLKFTGPTRAKVGDHYKYVISIKNSGSETAENVTVDYTLPIGISLINDPNTKTFTMSAGNMAPGSIKNYNIEVVADYAGIFINSVSVKGANAHDKHSSICTKVINRR